jgi:hypothetical protein
MLRDVAILNLAMAARKKLNQKGFSATAIIIVVIVLASGGFLFYFLSSRQSGPQVQQTTKKPIFPAEDSKTIKEPTQTRKESLIAYWSFDEGQGPSSTDLSGNDFQARINGATWTTGKKGNALEFDGQNDFVEFEQSALKKAGSLKYGTVSLWFKFKKPRTKKILPLLYLGEKESQEKIDNLIIEIGHFDHGFPQDTKLYYTVYNQGYEPILCFDSATNLKADTWYHFAVVNSPSGNTGYLNGVELTNRHYNFSDAKDTRFFNILNKKDTFQLGYGYFGIDQKFHYFEGTIDEVKIYQRPLTSSEIKTLATP